MSDVMYPTVLLFLSRPADSTNNVTFNELGLSAINNGESKWLPRPRSETRGEHRLSSLKLSSMITVFLCVFTGFTTETSLLHLQPNEQQ